MRLSGVARRLVLSLRRTVTLLTRSDAWLYRSRHGQRVTLRTPVGTDRNRPATGRRNASGGTRSDDMVTEVTVVADRLAAGVDPDFEAASLAVDLHDRGVVGLSKDEV